MRPQVITITPVLNGFVVNVGCQTVVFEDTRDLLNGLEEYYKDPAATTKQFLANKLNDTMADTPMQPPQAAPQPAYAVYERPATAYNTQMQSTPQPPIR